MIILQVHYFMTILPDYAATYSAPVARQHRTGKKADIKPTSSHSKLPTNVYEL